MTRLFNGVRAAGRIAYLALADAALFAAWTHHAACAAWVAVGLFSLWYIGETLLALSGRVAGRAYVAGCLLVPAVVALPASWAARLRVSFGRACADHLFLRRAVAAVFLLAFLLSIPVSLSTVNLTTTVGGGTSRGRPSGPGSTSQLAGIAFGTGMVLMAPAFLIWLFAGGTGGTRGVSAGMTCQSAFGGAGDSG